MEETLRITRPDEAGAKGFDKVFAFLREQLLNGTIRPGDRLIAERELAVQLGVSRPVLREALRALAMLGVVEIRQGMGTVVRRPDVSVLGEFFTFVLAQQSDITDDVMQARIAIECQAVRLACQRAMESDFTRLREALARIEATIDEPVAGGLADFAFHQLLVEAAHSATLRSVYSAISDLLTRSHIARREVVRVSPEMRAHLVEDHRRIYIALLSRDERQVDETLREHFAIGHEFRLRNAMEAARRAPAPQENTE
ncbi:FadR/GntR family transcriptional regulator [Teichococcus aestuarii]|uniref:GntR family transcriptional regulator n=1 Tax=Teichococcus aestuarii TaxID=568898 RepID=A0A2U1V3R9_9PROT|nr:FadR/GntR family transcriptional regulator [Pseudoroseomonas aestuarii]PWC28534.1 GntR family transcriptional regulator [Pseudoroseomonas aestuarii]